MVSRLSTGTVVICLYRVVSSGVTVSSEVRCSGTGAVPYSRSSDSSRIASACADGSALPAVEFDRHVASLFGRLGCNAGSCHGSFQGRGGLNLSLFGADPARDFQAIARGAGGRRVSVLDPDRSLVLLPVHRRLVDQVPLVLLMVAYTMIGLYLLVIS